MSIEGVTPIVYNEIIDTTGNYDMEMDVFVIIRNLFMISLPLIDNADTVQLKNNILVHCRVYASNCWSLPNDSSTSTLTRMLECQEKMMS